MYLTLVSLGLQFLIPFLSGLKQGKVPAEVAKSVQAAIDALSAHHADLVTKENLESQRG